MFIHPLPFMNASFNLLSFTNGVFLFLLQELWTLLSHLTLPLALFYRFHSSVCLADMWKAAYEEEESH